MAATGIAGARLVTGTGLAAVLDLVVVAVQAQFLRYGATLDGYLTFALIEGSVATLGSVLFVVAFGRYVPERPASSAGTGSV